MTLLGTLFARPRIQTTTHKDKYGSFGWACRFCEWTHTAEDGRCISYTRGWQLAIEHRCEEFPKRHPGLNSSHPTT